jgi:hypothetical protein
MQTFDLVKNLKEKFVNGDIQQRKTILQIIGSNLSIKVKKLKIEIRKPFEEIQ